MAKDDGFNNIKNPPIEIIGKEKCTGCFGCANACKNNAIEMKLSDDGFYFPEIIKSKCKNCGLCTYNCPILNSNNKNYSFDKVKVFAGFSTDNNIRGQSSSGGIFTEAAEYFIENEGVVSGAEWGENLSVKHVCIKEKSEISRLRSSKYIQSNLSSIYSEIKELVEKDNRKVLFTGTPCQAAALKTFTESKNLYVIDLLCHGVPSKIVFDEYVNFISKGRQVKTFNFRDKSSGWSKYKTKAEFRNGEGYECITRQDPFFHGYICDLYSNLSCYNCKFASMPRIGDITIGDFWKIPEDMMDERGISVILANNQKGLTFLYELEKQNKIKIYESSLETAVNGNPRINNGFLNMRKNRTQILNGIKREGFENIFKNYIEKTNRYIPD